MRPTIPPHPIQVTSETSLGSLGIVQHPDLGLGIATTYLGHAVGLRHTERRLNAFAGGFQVDCQVDRVCSPFYTLIDLPVTLAILRPRYNSFLRLIQASAASVEVRRL